MVLARYRGDVQMIVTGPLATSGVVPYTEGAEILWIRLKLGAYMPHLPASKMKGAQTSLPGAASGSFWLKGSAWEFPDFENADTFVDRLARAGVLVQDPLVAAVLQDRQPDVSPRTLRHRFLHATGLTQSHIRQIARAQRASRLLQQGVSILDASFDLGYADQSHLTRSLKQFVGYTPTQIITGRPDARA